jgi:putative membrane protein
MRRFGIALTLVALASLPARGQSAAAAGGAQRPGEAGQAADSRTFINELTIAGMTEVQLGKMAMERAASPEVKAFGQLMVADHSKAGDELKQVASQLKIQPPAQLDQKHQDLADRLAKLSGAEFDREYMAAMVKGHEEVLSKVKAQAGPSRPTDTAVGTTGGAEGARALTAWAAKAQPVVEQHLQRARDIQQKVAK